MARIGSFWILLVFFAVPVSAQSVQVTATVDRNQVGLGETLTVTVSAASEESIAAEEPRVPQLDGFDLLNSWDSSQTSSQLVTTGRGMQYKTVRRKNFNFVLSPKRLGTLSIPAFEMVVEGKTYFTKPITVQVLQENQNPEPQAPGGVYEEMDEAEQLFQQLLQRRGLMPQQGGRPSTRGPAKPPNINPKETFFIQLELDKTEAYEGEQITASWYIYTRGNILALDRVKFPDLKGFWKEIIEEVPALNFSSEIINGIPYQRALLASHALFPIKAGIAVVDEYKIKATVQVPSSSFGGIGFGPSYNFTRASERTKITVKPLPIDNRPKDFSGAVGQFEVNAALAGKRFVTNQPFSLRIRFEGRGNAKLIELPPMQLPPGVELYDTKSEAKFFKDGKSFREFELLIIPRQKGPLAIPSVSVSMFDPQKQVYYSKSTQAIDLQIEEGSESSLADSRLAEPEAEPRDQLPRIVQSYTETRAQSVLNWGILGITYLFVCLALVYKAIKELGFKRQQKGVSDQVRQRSKAILAVADSEWRSAAAQVTNLMSFALGEVAGTGGGSFEIKRLLELCPSSVRRELGEDLLRQTDYFQTLAFAPEEQAKAQYNKKEFHKNVRSLTDLLLRALATKEKAKS